MSQGAGASASGAPVAPNETLYIQNLNESVAIPGMCVCAANDAVMKQTLEALFTTYGPVLSIVAHKNLRMRGQAFVRVWYVHLTYTSACRLHEPNRTASWHTLGRHPGQLKRI